MHTFFVLQPILDIFNNFCYVVYTYENTSLVYLNSFIVRSKLFISNQHTT